MTLRNIAHRSVVIAGILALTATAAHAGDFRTWFGLKPLSLHTNASHDRRDDDTRHGRGADDGADHDAGDDHGGDRHSENGDDHGRGGDDHGHRGSGHD